VVLPGSQIGCGLRLKRGIVDKRCVLPDGLSVGFDPAQGHERLAGCTEGARISSRLRA
jgi:ADP-glucose pyrophosphorylase